MTKLRINPNRMELLRLRRRLIIAQRGHKLLEDKLEQLMPKFLIFISQAKALNSKVRRDLAQIMPLFIIVQGKISQEVFLRALQSIKADVDLELNKRKIMNVVAPEVNIKRIALELNYSLQETPAELDVAVLKLKTILADLIRLAGLLRVCQLLSYEIERTRRRVNALQYLLIPSIIETIGFIDDKLSEYERETLVRLMRVKEIVRSH